MNKTIYALSICALAAISSWAQDLSTEITVDRIVEPATRQALRPVLSPNLLSPQRQAGLPQAAEFIEAGTITPLLTRLGVARWQDSIAHTPYRGYIGGGYFPSMNLGLDAGYRFVDQANAALGAALQYNGQDYSRDGFDLNTHHLRANVDASWLPNDFSRLWGNVSYRFAKVQDPIFNTAEDLDHSYYTQNVNQFGFNAGWLSQPGSFGYDLAFGIDHFGMGKEMQMPLVGDAPFAGYEPIKQTLTTFKIGAGLVRDASERRVALAQPRWLGAEVDGAFLSNNNGFSTLSLVHVRPYVRFGKDAFSGSADLNVSVSSGLDETKVLFSPEFSVAYASPTKPFGASLTMTGGRQLNTASSLFDADPYISPYNYYAFSHTLMDLEAVVSFGPAAGFQFEVFGGFALPRDWLMPVLDCRYAFGGTMFQSLDAESTRIGGRLSYSFKSYFELGVSAQWAESSDSEMTWYRWLDSAKGVYSAWLTVHPISALDIKLAWDLRTGRHAYAFTTGVSGYDSEASDSFTNAPIFPAAITETKSLGDAATITAAATYRITPALSAFVNAEIHNKHLLVSGLPAPTLTGLAGISFKF